jgi:signal transduction histidine kinase
LSSLLPDEDVESEAMELKLISDALLVTNEKLELKTHELTETNKALFDSHNKLAEIYHELATANKRLALINKRFAEVIKKLTHSNRQLRIVNQRTKEYDNLNADFINKAAHEIRTPIHNILGYSELLLMELENDKTNTYHTSKNQSIQAIFRNANRLQMLTEGVLIIARIQSKTLKLNKKQINLIAEIRGFIEHIIGSEIITNNKKIEIVFQPEEEYITIEADKVLLQGIIQNLLDSSIKLQKDDGTISVNVKKFNDKVHTSIKLAVTGVDLAVLPSLFTKFEYKSYQGLGLSLFIAKTIVEVHAGRIWIDIAPNSNVVLFTFSLPVGCS